MTELRIPAGSLPNQDAMAKHFPGRRLGRFSAFRRTDGQWIVHDPARPFGHQTAWGPGDQQGAYDAMTALSGRADASGEPNVRSVKGFRQDWGDPRTWEREAVRYLHWGSP